MNKALLWWGALLTTTLTQSLWADEAVNLDDLGISDFTPYVVERNSLWILLPVISLAFVFLHLTKKPRKLP